MKKLLSAVMLAGAMSANAATVAVIDSGTDLLHKALEDNAWVNPHEIAHNNRDEDGNGYQDDVNGWNFAEGNNKVIDRKYLGSFSADPYIFFAIQERMFLGTVTEEDRQWVATKRQDEEFMKEMQIFGNFVHGTHVAGIAAQNSNHKVLAVKLIPTEVKPFATEAAKLTKGDGASDFAIKLVKGLLSTMAKQQMTLLSEIGVYVGNHDADVANGSFGTGYNQARMIVEMLLKKGTDEQKHDVALHFLNELIKEGARMVQSAPKTLFVFAAGNDGINNTKYPTSPANIKAPNVITVAATHGRAKIAGFSNYGDMVEVAAPGVIINNAIPGNEYLKVSGTSQAAPYVANLAGKVKDANPALMPADIKKIIMATVDKKGFLREKVLTSGIVNTPRAEMAASLSKRMGVDEAIKTAIDTVSDIQEDVIEAKSRGLSEGMVLPLPSMFK